MLPIDAARIEAALELRNLSLKTVVLPTKYKCIFALYLRIPLFQSCIFILHYAIQFQIIAKFHILCSGL